MRDVGDRDEQAEAVVARLGVHRVVEIACASAPSIVTSGDLAQIDAALRSRPATTSGSTSAASRSTAAGHSCGRSWLAIAISTTSDGVRRSPSTARMRPIGPRCTVGWSVISTMTICPERAPRSSPGVISTSWCRRRSSGVDQHQAVFLDHAADQARRAAFQHFDDRALAAAAAIDADDAGQHAVAVQHLAHLGRRQIQIVAALVGTQEAVAFGVGDARRRGSGRACWRRRNRRGGSGSAGRRAASRASRCDSASKSCGVRQAAARARSPRPSSAGRAPRADAMIASRLGDRTLVAARLAVRVRIVDRRRLDALLAGQRRQRLRHELGPCGRLGRTASGVPGASCADLLVFLFSKAVSLVMRRQRRRARRAIASECVDSLRRGQYCSRPRSALPVRACPGGGIGRRTSFRY